MAALYDPRGPLAGVRWAAVAAWLAGLATYYAVPGNATVPSLVVAIGGYLAFAPHAAGGADPVE